MTQLLTFEQPLNERMRTFLRFEHLMRRFRHSARGESPWDSHCALSTLIETADLTARVDLKSELMKELKRQVATLDALSASPEVDLAQLQRVVQTHRAFVSRLDGHPGQLAGMLKHNEFLNSFKQRAVIPGGTCNFDLPSYHFWLGRPATERQRDLESWARPFAQLTEAIQVVLGLVRQSATPERLVAKAGFFQRNLDPSAPVQLIRISIHTVSSCFPEISAGKHRFSVRFLEPRNLELRPKQTQGDVQFDLAICAL